MTLATQHLVSTWQSKFSGYTSVPANVFSVMYTPMNSKSFEDYGKDSLSMFVAMVFECLILCMNKLLTATDEPREDMILLIMKRMGV